jgi:hypothetical protein
MPVNLLQNTDGSATLGQTDDDGLIHVSTEWIATSVDKAFFIATRPYVVKAITARPRVVGSDSGTVTAAIKKAASATAPASGTALHTGTIDLKGTADTNQALTLSTTPATLKLAAGDALCIDFTGTLTAAVGTVSVALSPA